MSGHRCKAFLAGFSFLLAAHSTSAQTFRTPSDWAISATSLPAPISVMGKAVSAQDTARIFESELWALGFGRDDVNFLVDLRNFIHKNFVRDVSDGDLLEGIRRGLYSRRVSLSKAHRAAKGMVDKLDKHSFFMTPEEYRKFKIRRDGGTERNPGLFLMQDKKKGEPLTVLAVVMGSPAEQAGIKAGDEILSINSKSVLDEYEGAPEEDGSDDEAEPRDITTVVIRRNESGAGNSRHLTISLRIKDIQMPDVDSRLLSNSIGYIHVAQFETGTDARFEQALEGLYPERLNGLIIDLRHNSGGSIDSTTNILSHFLPKNSLLSLNRGKKYNDESRTKREGAYQRVPLAVLVDGRSASASELVAAAIKAHRRGLIIGSRTYGKGSTQYFFPNSKTGDAIYLTTDNFYDKDGVAIQGVGVQPHIRVDLTPSENRRMLFDLYGRLTGDWSGDSTDPVVTAAVKALRR